MLARPIQASIGCEIAPMNSCRSMVGGLLALLVLTSLAWVPAVPFSARAEIARVAGEDPPELFTACSVLRPGVSVAAVSRSSKKAKQTAVPLGS